MPSIKFSKLILGALAAYALSCKSTSEHLYFTPSSSEASSLSSDGYHTEAPKLAPLVGAAIKVYPAFSQKDLLTWADVSNTPACQTLVAAQEGTEQSSALTLSLPLKLSVAFDRSISIAFDLQTNPFEGESALLVQIDGQQFHLLTAAEDIAQVRQNLCLGQQNSETNLATYAILSQWIQELSPDCHLEKLGGEAWLCRLPTLEPKNVLNELAELQKNVLKKWTRQPYLFLRRLTVTRQLAHLLSEDGDPTAVEHFCNLLEVSYKNELPLVMGLAKWQEGLCRSNGPAVREWARIGLEQATQELAFLHGLLDTSSVIGNLSVHIPSQSHAAKELWVQLNPTEQVSEQVLIKALSLNPDFSMPETTTEATEEIKQTATSVETLETQAAQLCWHPLYSSEQQHSRLAALMLLTSQRSTACRQTLPTTSRLGQAHMAAYLYEAIMGESTFLVGNGQSKILQLPEGAYQYTLYNLPADSTRWTPAMSTDQSQGSFAWDSHKPQARIMTW